MTTTTATRYHSMNDRYDKQGGVYTLTEFQDMCAYAFGAEADLYPTEVQYDGEWRNAFRDDKGIVLVEYREGDLA
jgi:hypothetical protein